MSFKKNIIMLSFKNIQDLIEADFSKLPDNAFIYKSPQKDLFETEFLIIEEKEIQDEVEDESGLFSTPLQAFEKGMLDWIEVPTLKDIVSNYLSKNEKFDQEKIIQAIRHYDKFDDFMF